MKAKPTALFHFTSSFENLCSILRVGFWPRYCVEDIRWTGFGEEYYAVPMVCFCDIPLSRINGIVQDYGVYGLGLTKAWGIASGLNPLLYVTENSLFTSSLLKLFENPSNEDKDSKVHVMHALAYTKPFNGKIMVHGRFVDKLFYEECEWRYVPMIYEGSHYPCLFKEEFENKNILDKAHEERRNDSKLTFTPADIKYIIVQCTKDISPLIDFMNVNLTHCAADQLKILHTRIVALEELLPDL